METTHSSAVNFRKVTPHFRHHLAADPTQAGKPIRRRGINSTGIVNQLNLTPDIHSDCVTGNGGDDVDDYYSQYGWYQLIRATHRKSHHCTDWLLYCQHIDANMCAPISLICYWGVSAASLRLICLSGAARFFVRLRGIKAFNFNLSIIGSSVWRLIFFCLPVPVVWIEVGSGKWYSKYLEGLVYTQCGVLRSNAIRGLRAD